MEFIPHDYQKAAEQFILDHEKCGLFLDMGLGKTVTTYTALEKLIYDYLEVKKVLVIAPKRVAEDTWPTELEKWDHLKKLKVSLILGTPKKRLAALRTEADIYVITRDNVAWLVDTLGKKWMFDTLVIDELSSFKNPSSKRFKKLKTVTPYFKRVIGLTGTPAPNSYLDLWSQIYLLDRGESLGRNVTTFRSQYFNGYNLGSFTNYTIKKGAKEEIDEKLKKFCISMKAKDHLKNLKEPVLVDVKAKLTPAEYKVYKNMERDALLEIDDDTTITALSAATVSNKLAQLANGAIYDADGTAHIIHSAKLECLEELAEEAQGENILVFYNYKSDLERIQERFPHAVKLETDSDIKKWNRGEIQMLLAHPASCGHGLNLQDGGSIIVWYGLTWSLELYLQANARLQRQGQKNTVRIYRILSDKTIDEQIVGALENKNFRQEQLLEELKRGIE